MVVSVAFSQHQWQRLNGPNGGFVTGVYVSPNGTFFVATGADRYVLLRSTDKGETWEEILTTLSYSSGRPYESISDLQFGTDGSCVLIKKFSFDPAVVGRAYRSTDNGTTWSLFKDSVDTFLGSGKPGEFFLSNYSTATQKNTILRTTNAGISWTDISTLFQSPFPAKLFWVKEQTYLASFAAGGCVVSTDNAAHFGPFYYFDHNDVVDIGLQPDGDLYEIFRSSQDGQYHLVSGDLVNPSTTSREFPPAMNPSGHNFATNAYPLVGLEYLNGCYTEYGGYAPHLFYYDPATKDIRQVKSMPPFNFRYPTSTHPFAASDTTGVILYANGEGLFKTTDLGASWKELPISYGIINFIQVNKFNEIFAKRGHAHGFGNYDFSWLHYSRNWGKTWSRISPVGHAYFGILGPGYEGGIITSVGDSNCDFGGALYYYGGTETEGWTRISRFDIQPGFGLLVDSVDNVVFNDNGLIAFTDDKGISWNKMGTPAGPIKDDPVGGPLVYSPSWKLYTSDGSVIFTSTNSGQTWEKVKVGIRDLFLETILVPKDGMIYFTTKEKGVYRSVDDGITWNKFIGPWGDSATCLGYGNDGSLYIGTKTLGLFSCKLDGSQAVKEPVTVLTGHINTIHVHNGKDVFIGADYAPIWLMEGQESSVSSRPVRTSNFSASIVTGGTAYDLMLQLNCNSLLNLSIEVYDVLGKKVAEVPAKQYSMGDYYIPIDVKMYASGTYFLRIVSATESKTISFIR